MPNALPPAALSQRGQVKSTTGIPVQHYTSACPPFPCFGRNEPKDGEGIREKDWTFCELLSERVEDSSSGLKLRDPVPITIPRVATSHKPPPPWTVVKALGGEQGSRSPGPGWCPACVGAILAWVAVEKLSARKKKLLTAENAPGISGEDGGFKKV